MALQPHVELFNRPGTARVDRPILPNQRGRVFFGGTSWPARYYASHEFVDAEAASHVAVLGRQGVTLLVAPLTADLRA